MLALSARQYPAGSRANLKLTYLRTFADYASRYACKFVKKVPQYHELESAAGKTVPPCSKKVGRAGRPGDFRPTCLEKGGTGKFSVPPTQVGQIQVLGWSKRRDKHHWHWTEIRPFLLD
jgi:hypothetical protein